MKRSEMLKLIRCVIVLDDGFNSNNGMAPVDDPELSEKILSVVEQVMIQPSLYLDGAGEHMLTKELLDYSEIDYTLGWEDE